MPGLKNTTISGGYKSLVRIDDNNGIGSSAVQCTDGDGNSTSMKMSKNLVQVQPSDSDGNAFEVNTSSASNKFRVNTNTPYVTALGHYVNTQYAYFGVNYVDVSSFAANKHYPISFMAANGGASLTNDVDFGTGTDPDTTFTTADTDSQYASQLVPMMWYVPDNISIDSVCSIEGADAATGDTTRMHLMSYTFNSGSTSALASGTLLAHNSDVTNAGNEQAYKSTWTVDSASVTAGKVILAFFRSDSVNSDFSLNITVKYHLV
tara:strand:- start:309 stop:1097 length:789 start_codon:yes stop_codon:yes gene_type:complete